MLIDGIFDEDCDLRIGFSSEIGLKWLLDMMRGRVFGSGGDSATLLSSTTVGSGGADSWLWDVEALLHVREVEAPCGLDMRSSSCLGESRRPNNSSRLILFDPRTADHSDASP